MHIEAVINGILNREGGFVNHPNDKGGATKYGITQSTLKGYRGRPASVADVQNLTKEEAYAIYLRNYVTRPGFDKIKDEALAEQLIDAGVNHGVGQSVILLQRALKLHDDGVLGPMTLAEIDKHPRSVVFSRFMQERCKFYGKILSKVSQRVFAAGWMNRVAEMLGRYADAIEDGGK